MQEVRVRKFINEIVTSLNVDLIFLAGICIRQPLIVDSFATKLLIISNPITDAAYTQLNLLTYVGREISTANVW